MTFSRNFSVLVAGLLLLSVFIVALVEAFTYFPSIFRSMMSSYIPEPFGSLMGFILTIGIMFIIALFLGVLLMRSGRGGRGPAT